MADLNSLREEKKQIFEDVYNGIIPKRVPISVNLPLEFCIQYAGLPLAETQWSLANVEEVLDKACREILSTDSYPFNNMRYPAHFKILEAKTFVMGSNGFMQHPEVSGLAVEDYEDFIANPYDCIMEKVLPRLYPKLDTDPVRRSIVLAKAMIANLDYMRKYRAIEAKLTAKYGFYSGPVGSAGGVTAPFDTLADFLRGFSGISMDVRRCPEKVAEACEALLPLSIKKGLPPKPSKYGNTFIALHMATYLRTKDFEKLFWPSLYKMVHKFAELGQPCLLFCEHDWSRYLDYLYDLPENTRLYFEYGDAKKIKDKLGKKHILSGLYPITYLKTATKEQCIDKAKELLDVLAPGGRYIFRFDKNPLILSDVKLENYVAVLKYISENAKYANAGQPSPAEQNSTQKVEAIAIPEFKSKYYQSWDDYKAMHEIDHDLEPVVGPILQSYEDLLFNLLSWLT